MKNTIIAIAVLGISFAACNNRDNKLNQSQGQNDDTTQAKQKTKIKETKGRAAVKDIVNSYLQIKNALANDNGKDAATAGNAMVDAISKADKGAFNADQTRVYLDITDDAKEMAEHIGRNADKIEHQREHFDMLSTDVYDLVKTFGAGQPLYMDSCPMYNKKGATWLSENKEINNPYLGKKMPKCGFVKEELE
jgi:hypothetical protein